MSDGAEVISALQSGHELWNISMNAGRSGSPEVPLADCLHLGEDLERTSENSGNTQRDRITLIITSSLIL